VAEVRVVRSGTAFEIDTRLSDDHGDLLRLLTDVVQLAEEEKLSALMEAVAMVARGEIKPKRVDF
jgi:hypothetical protein